MAGIGLCVEQYRALPWAERDVLDAWLERVAGKNCGWFRYELVDESGLNLAVSRYLRNEQGNRFVDPDDRTQAARETVLFPVTERPPILRALED